MLLLVITIYFHDVAIYQPVVSDGLFKDVRGVVGL